MTNTLGAANTNWTMTTAKVETNYTESPTMQTSQTSSFSTDSSDISRVGSQYNSHLYKQCDNGKGKAPHSYGHGGRLYC